MDDCFGQALLAQEFCHSGCQSSAAGVEYIVPYKELEKEDN
jgi:hypothetical protein